MVLLGAWIQMEVSKKMDEEQKEEQKMENSGGREREEKWEGGNGR